jgi:protein SCO1/2
MRLRPIAALIAAPLVAAVVIGVAVGWWVAAPKAVTLVSGTALEAPRAIGAFRLTDHRGREFTTESLRGGWSLVFAGFTHCPDACPTTLAMLNSMEKRLRANGGAIQVVFLSVDPARDTTARLAAYVGHFNPRFVAVTGARADIDALSRDLGIGYVQNPGVGSDYTVDHSAALVLIDPRARVAGHFRPPHDPAALAADLVALTVGAG